MAIVKCPNCDKNISENAPKCPHCGFDMTNRSYCSACGHEILKRNALCPECGADTPWRKDFVTCSECGELIPRDSESCPSCGIELADITFCKDCGVALDKSKPSCSNCGAQAPWSRKCPQCGNFVMPSEGTCPECGFDMVKHFGATNVLPQSATPATMSYEDTEEEEIPRNYTKWVIIAIICLLLGGGTWYTISSHKAHEAKVAREKFVADSIQAEKERVLVLEAEQQRLESERRERERQEYMEQQRREEERRQAEAEQKHPSFLYGTWRASLNTPYGEVANYVLIISNSSLTYQRNGKVEFSGDWEYQNGKLYFANISYSYNNELGTIGDYSRTFRKDGGRYQQDTTFSSPYDVINYTSQNTFRLGNQTVRITDQGFVLQGNYITGAPQVVNYTSTTATIRGVTFVGNQVVTATVNCANGTLRSCGETYRIQ